MFSRWRRRPGRSTAASLGPVAVAAVLALAVPLAVPLADPASASPSDQPGGTTGVLESEALDRLQQRAAEVQESLREQQDDVVAARAAMQRASAGVASAEAVLEDVEDELAAHREVVARYAAAAYRDGGGLTPLTVLLSGADPGEVPATLGLLEVAGSHAAAVIGAAESLRQEAVVARREAAAALEEARVRSDEVAVRVAELEAAAAAVTEELDRALGEVDRQLAQLQAEQHRVNEETAANWRAYLEQLAAIGVSPPPAAALLDPDAGLPAGLVPVGSSSGGAQRGAAQHPGRPSSSLVLPAETLAAVTAAMVALGRPYAPGTAGPESWDCGSLVSAAYGGTGVPLPTGQADLFAVTVPVDVADVLPGDLVFLGTEEAGPGHVGIALDPRTMLAADARAGAVVVRPLEAGEVLGIGRPSLGQRSPVAVPGPAVGAARVECGNTVHPPGFDGARQWGGYPNGLIPSSAMCPLGVAGHQLRCDAAAAYRAMSAAFAADTGAPLCITDSYRTFAGQVDLYRRKPALAAVPGTSNHGWGLAVDLCGGIERFGTPQYDWMVAHAGRFGYLHPTWADPGNGREEPWHWEYAGT
jgi:cell wall-associated NlpC family hydrolase